MARLVRRALVGLLLGLPVFVGCGHSRAETADLAVRLASEPNPPRVGEVVLLARISDRRGHAVPVSGVRFHYYPFVQRVKDSLASPDEVVRVLEGEKVPEGYRAKATFDRPGPWKVILKVVRPDAPEVLRTFTLDVPETR
jgi:hypothetical protein